MKKYIYLLLMLPLLLLAACYEGSDLGELYDSNIYSTQIKHVEIKSIGSTYADIDFRLSCAKYDSEIKLYYTDKLNIDPYPNGSSITIAKIPRQDSIKEQFSAKLEKLNPDTKYRYVIVSTDPSGHTTISKENSFSTSSFDIYTWVSASVFNMSITTSFYNVPLGAEYGLAIGSTPNVSVDHCLEKKIFGHIQSVDWIEENVLLKDIAPSTTFYFRPYVIYQDKIYYGDINKEKTEEISLKLRNISYSFISSYEVMLFCNIELNTDYDEFEYGFELSQSTDFEQATEYPIQSTGWLQLSLNDLKPGTKYYYRAYIQRNAQKFYSQVQHFETHNDYLSGDIDSLYINGQLTYFVLVKAGTFTMGATPEQTPYARKDEFPAHEVTISEDFYISQTEVTSRMVSSYPPGYVYRTSRANAIEYVNSIQNSLSNLKVTLPTEAEWEYAARGGHLSPKQTLYAGSNTLQEVAWVYDPSYIWRPTDLPSVQNVKEKAPNALGIYDMSGNAAEWTLDAYQSDYYSTSPSTDPCCTTSDNKQSYVVRGGGTYTYDKYYSDTDYRVAARNYADNNSELFTFRLIIRNTHNK